jgi:hypothetical protein
VRVEVWKCRKTGTLFEDTTDWRRYLTKKAAQKLFLKRRKERRAKAEICVDELRMLGSFEAIEQWLETNYALLFERQIINGNINFWGEKTKTMPKGFALKNVRLLNMTWQDSCSNTHCAPRGKFTNWGGDKKGYPRGFPGYRGRIEFEIGKHYTHSSDLFRDTGIHTGSGGGGEFSGYDVTMFAEEWPMLVFNDPAWRQNANFNRSTDNLFLVEGKITLPSQLSLARGRDGSTHCDPQQ